MRLSPRRIALALLIVLAAAVLLYVFGRSLWHPLVVRLAGEASVEDRLAEIVLRQPDLAHVAFRDVAIVAYKQPGVVLLFNDGRLWESYPTTATSGGPGPKTRAGDRQIPEGVYTAEALNPNSSFHLSVRVSYPNAEDRARSAGLGVTDLGGDIYLHGKASSIGCLAIGDRAIERLFYAVAKSGFARVPIIIAPQEAYDDALRRSPHAATYDRVYAAIRDRIRP